MFEIELDYRVTHHVGFKPPVDTKTKVMFLYMDLIIKHNLCFDVNGRFGVSTNVMCHPVVA